MILGSELDRVRKYKSVVTLKSPGSPEENTQIQYRRNFVSRHSPAKSTSPTHEALLRRRLSTSDYTGNIPEIELPVRMMTSSEYFSMSHSSEESDT